MDFKVADPAYTAKAVDIKKAYESGAISKETMLEEMKPIAEPVVEIVKETNAYVRNILSGGDSKKIISIDDELISQDELNQVEEICSCNEKSKKNWWWLIVLLALIAIYLITKNNN